MALALGTTSRMTSESSLLTQEDVRRCAQRPRKIRVTCRARIAEGKTCLLQQIVLWVTNAMLALNALKGDGSPPMETELLESLKAMVHAVCGPTGFAAAVRGHSGKAYPWESLELAEDVARKLISKAEAAQKAQISSDAASSRSSSASILRHLVESIHSVNNIMDELIDEVPTEQLIEYCVITQEFSSTFALELERRNSLSSNPMKSKSTKEK